MSIKQSVYDSIKEKDKRIQEKEKEKEIILMSNESIAEFKAILKREEYKIASGYCKH